MKKFYSFALVALVALVAIFTACTYEITESIPTELEIKLKSEVTLASRVADANYQSTQIVEGQQVGVTITGAKNGHINGTWTAGADGSLTNTEEAVYYGNGAATITAYHPYNSIWASKNHMFSVSTDQSTNEGYLVSDLLWATATSAKTESPVVLTFAHMLAKINVTLTSTDMTDLSDATISICGTNIATSFNSETGELSAATTANVQEITAGVTTPNALTASAIVIPQTVEAGTKFIKVSHGGKTLYYTLTADKELKSGHSYSYTLTVKEAENELKLKSENIIDWDDETNEGVLEEGDLEEESIPYVTFTADAEQSLTMSRAVDGLEYSVNGGEWSTLGTETIPFGGEKGQLRLRGINSYGTAKSSNDSYSTIEFSNNTPVACTGDIRTLVDYENYSTAETGNARFCSLFEGCTSLTSAPELPATTLAHSCYSSMFYGCTSLVNAPELPATTLAGYCYFCMFYSCESLVNAPELPATTLSYWCYTSMFYGCESLVNAPALPATTLASECYSNMFYGCTSLVNAPELPATTLDSECYHRMFSGCTSLVNAPELPATTLAHSCYWYMFYGCTSLVNAPELPATTLAHSCYSSMFEGCTSLVNAPELPATTLDSECYSHMFSGCTSLVNAPELPATTLALYCYSSMFKGCKNLKKVTMLATDISAEGCLNSWLAAVSSTGTFIKAASMTTLPEGENGIPAGWTVISK